MEELLTCISLEDEDKAESLLGAIRSDPYILHDKKLVSDFFGVSIETVGLWQRKGMPYESGGKGVPGRYDLRECVQWYVEQKQAPLNESTEETEANTKYRQEKAKYAALQRQQLERKLVDADEFREGMIRVVDLIRKGVDGLHKRFGNDVVEALSTLLDEVEATLRDG